MNYWLDLFTGTTWNEFRKAGANISGFRERMRPNARRVESGDVFLCYLTGVMRWVGALEVLTGLHVPTGTGLSAPPSAGGVVITFAPR